MPAEHNAYRGMEIFAFGAGRVISLTPLKGMTAVGGARSTGVRLSGLKHDDDYAVVTASEGRALVHVLKGKKRGQVLVEEGESCTVEDLTLLHLPSSADAATSDPTNPFADGFDELLRRFSEEGPLEPALQGFLDRLIRATEMEKGILLTRALKGGFRAVATAGIQQGDPWLAEALVQDTLKSRQPIWLQNRVGSAFESSKSLISAGFLSVFSLPLVARGEILGAVVLGSMRPHGGLSDFQRSRTESFSRFGALLFWFQQREEALRLELERLQVARGSNCPLLTSSARLQSEIGVARRVANTRLSVLIQGETGVGKELMAQWIHEQSERSRGPFVAINCGAIPHELLESVLFGHKKGAFTGAFADQPGKFLAAHEGTLFLDEIGDLPERLQVKLLRVLQEGVIEPVGSVKPVKVDVRILAATHRNLSELVKAGRFRQDLFYRIAEVVTTLPPLRERPEDVALLASVFLKECAPDKSLPLPTLEWLSNLPWPGNVRELRSAVNRAAALANTRELSREDFLVGLPREAATERDSSHWLEGRDLEEAKQRFVQQKIQLALERSGGNRQKAAELLGVTARTLFRYLEDSRERQELHDA